MGLLSFPLPCQSQSQSQSNEDSESYYLQLQDASLSSQPSLPSVPSLTFSSSFSSSSSTTTHHQCISTLKGHSSYVFSLSLAGKHLYSGSSNSHILKWPRNPSHDLPSNNNNLITSGNSAVKSIIIVGDKLFSAHQDYKIRVWKIDNNNNNEDGDDRLKNVATLPKLNDRFITLFSSKNYVKVRRHKKCTWVHHVDTVSALALSSDASLLYSVSWDRTFKIWRTSDFKCLESVWNAHDDAINAVVVSNDGFVYTGSADRKIKVWKRNDEDKKHRLVATLEKHKSAINALALSSDGSVLYSGACDRSIIVWEKNGGGCMGVVVGALRGHTKAILCLGVVSDLVFSGSADKTVRIWRKERDQNSYCCLAVLEGHRGPVKCLTATIDNAGNTNSSSGNSYKIYSGGLDCDIKVWQLWVQSF